MSGKGFHVHGPHDHEVEHQAHAAAQGMAGRLAVATAIIATVGALFAYMGGLKQVNAGLYKNEAAIKKTDAANQWAFYQAKNNRQNISELAVELVPDARKDYYRGEAARYKAREGRIAEGGGKAREGVEGVGRAQRARDPRAPPLAAGDDRAAIAIAMAAIALLTRSRRLQVGVYGLAAVGVVLGGLATAHI